MVFRNFAVYGIALGAFAVRLIGLSSGRLPFDELLSGNFSNHSLVEVVTTVARFDVHPPLYYVQLAAWMLFGNSDQFLLLNSVLWGILAVGGLYLVAVRLMRHERALVAAVLLAASPSAVFYSQQVRMYSMIMFLCTLSFWFMLRFLKLRKISDLVLMVCGMLAVVYSHGVGFVMIAGVSLYAFVSVMQQRQPRMLRQLAVAHAILLVTSVPAVVFAATHGVAHPVAPTMSNLIGTFRFLLVGTANAASTLPLIVYSSVAVIIAGVCLCREKSRVLFATTVLIPIALVFAISHLVSPIWLDRTLLFTVPFMLLSLVLALDAPGGDVHKGCQRISVAALGLVMIAILAMLSIEQQRYNIKGDDYWPMARYIDGVARSGDLVVLNTDELNLWCFLWYFAGPDWGRPLAFHNVNEKWQRFLGQLGPEWTHRLGLIPSQRGVTVRGVTVTATFIDAIPLAFHNRVFVISPLKARYSLGPGFERGETHMFREFVIEVWMRQQFNMAMISANSFDFLRRRENVSVSSLNLKVRPFRHLT